MAGAPFTAAAAVAALVALTALAVGALWYLRKYLRSPRRLQGLPVLVLGGANGTGLVIARRLSLRGARVVVADRDEPAQALPACTFIRCDVARRENVARLQSAVVATIGWPKVVVNCVGVVTGKTLLDATDDELDETVRTNLLSHMWVARAFVPEMIRANDGHLVTFGSSMGFVGTAQLGDYCATKAGLYSFNEALRMELRAAGVSRVHTTILCTGLVTSGMFEGIHLRFPLLTPPLTPEYVADRVIETIIWRHEPEIWEPLFVRGVPVLRVLPTQLYDLLQDFMGVNTAMRGFVGRQRKP